MKLLIRNLIVITICYSCAIFSVAFAAEYKGCPSKESLKNINFNVATRFGSSNGNGWLLTRKLDDSRVNFILSELDAETPEEALMLGQEYYDTKVILHYPEQIDENLCIYTVTDDYTVFTSNIIGT